MRELDLQILPHNLRVTGQGKKYAIRQVQPFLYVMPNELFQQRFIRVSILREQGSGKLPKMSIILMIAMFNIITYTHTLQPLHL